MRSHAPWIALVPVAAAAAALVVACFDFAATSAGGRAGDGGVSPHDGDVSPEGATGSYCASVSPPLQSNKLSFCDDFDERPLPGEWQTFSHQGGSLAETDASAESPPSSLDEKTNVLGADQPIDVALRTPFAAPLPALPLSLSFGFSVSPITLDTTTNATIVLGAIDFLDAANERYSVEMSLTVASGVATLELGEQSGLADGAAPYVNHPVPPPYTLHSGVFTQIIIGIDWTGTQSASATVTVGGGTALSNVPLTMTIVPSSLQIGVGTSYVTEPSPGWELRYDDVLFIAN